MNDRQAKPAAVGVSPRTLEPVHQPRQDFARRDWPLIGNRQHALAGQRHLNRLAFRAVPQGLCGCHAYKATAGWRFGNLIDGTQAEYVLVPDAQANLAPIPGF